MDYETQFCSHLCDSDAVRYFLNEGITEEILFSPAAKSIYVFVQHYMEESGEAPSLEVLQDQYPKFVFTPSPEAAPHWLVTRLRDRYQQAKVQDLIREAAKKVKEPEGAFAYLRETIYGIESATATKRSLYSPADFASKLEEYRIQVKEGRYRGAPFGFKEVDDFTSGHRPGHLSFTLARPGRLKTWFATYVFVQQALADWCPVLFQLELTEEDQFGRIACLVSGFPYYKWARGEVNEEEFEMIASSLEEFRKHEHYVVCPSHEERSIAKLALEADRLDAGAIIIDQLSFLRSRKSYSHNHEAVSEIVYDLKNLATRKRHELPVMCIAQLNRTAAQQDTMADISQAALSDAIGQASDTIYCLHRTRDMADQDQVELGIIKGRSHGVNSWMIQTDLYRRTEFKLIEEVDE